MLIVALLLLAVLWTPLEAGSAPVGPRPSTVPPPGALPPFGVEATNWTTGTAVTQAGQVAATDTSWTRFNELQWSVIQPVAARHYDWSAYDPIMLALAQQPLTPLVIIGDTPVWAEAYPGLPSGPIASAHLSDFVQFVQAAVTRYSQSPYNIHNWELFNEPDSTSTQRIPVISTWGNHGSDYAAMLQAVYPAIKAADPSSTVMMGSLAYDWFTYQGGPFNRNFISDVLNAGGGPYFDVLGFHYYATFGPEWAPYGIDILGKYNYLRGILSSHGLASKRMASTEIGQFGVPSNPSSLAIQANYVPQVYARGMSAGLLTMVWYSLVVGTSDTGLIASDGTQKPAYGAYQVAAAELGGVTYRNTISGSTINLQGAPSTAFEGYLFQVTGSSAYRAVIWLNSGSGTITLHVPFLDEVTTNGSRSHLVADASGQVSLLLDSNPIYLELPANPWTVIYIPFVPQ
jgi:Cellulase (glycosyl hydrolase family 5)